MNKEEILEQKKRRLVGKRLMPDYLKELNALTNIEINENMLLSIIDTDNLRGGRQKKQYKTRILFHEKERLLIFIGELIKIKDGMCYLFITYSTNCGALKLNSLKDFNMNFNFKDEHAGILNILQKDLLNELLLDYYEEGGEYYLEIEAYGDDWSKARVI